MTRARTTRPAARRRRRTTNGSASTAGGGSVKIRVRMYDVGFGDCFLVTWEDTAKRAILVDAGFHSQGKGSFGGKDLATQVIADVEAAVGDKRVDVLIATHRHQDHITTFNAPEWDALAVGEVWMPWVDDPDDASAAKLWKKKKSFALALERALPSFALDENDRAAVDFMLWNAGVGKGPPGFEAWSNAGALDRLRTGLARRDRQKPRYLPETQTFPEEVQSPALPGTRVWVLGPPRDPDLIEELDPTTEGESYRALTVRAAEAAGALLVPFDDAWVVPGDAARDHSFEGEEEERIADMSRAADVLFAATVLDDMINSTSLVLVLEIGATRLLLPGDAEWGTWKRILADDGARTVLKGTSFFKVGHHGSHNATPKTLVEEVLRSEVHAMISTQEGPGNYRNNIPLPALLEALHDHGIEAVRSDRPKAALPAGYSRGPGGKWVDLEL